MKALLTFYLVFLFYGTNAQKKPATSAPVRQALKHSVYDNWKEITFKSISPDGNYAAFTVNPQDGDGKAIFYHLKTNLQDSIKRADNIALTFDNHYAVFKIKPQQKLVRDMRRQKKKKEDLPKDSLGIYSFLSRKT